MKNYLLRGQKITESEAVEIASKSERVGIWWNNNDIELVKIDGKIYALDGWNGEKFTHCWECIDELTAADPNAEYNIAPVYQEDDEEYEIIGYVLV